MNTPLSPDQVQTFCDKILEVLSTNETDVVDDIGILLSCIGEIFYQTALQGDSPYDLDEMKRSAILALAHIINDAINTEEASTIQ